MQKIEEEEVDREIYQHPDRGKDINRVEMGIGGERVCQWLVVCLCGITEEI